MKSTSVALASHLAGDVTTLATCWRVTRTDGQVFGFTSFDRDLVVAGVTYAAATGITRSAIDSKATLAVDNAEATGFLDSGAITEDDLRAGVWDHAGMVVFEVNHQDLTQGALKQMRGWLGEVTREGQTYKVELRGLAAALNKSIGEVVTPACAAALGDARCGVDLTDYTTTGEVTAVTSNRIVDTDLASSTVRLTPSSTGAPTEDYFGLVTWLTGANAGRRVEVKAYGIAGELELQLPTADNIVAGDTFSAVARCAKSRAVCIAQFDNLLNFRGFPDVPGVDQIMRYGGQ